MEFLFLFFLSFHLPKIILFFLLFISLQSFRSKYLETQTAVRNCYERALRAAAVLDVGDPRISMASEKNVADVGYPLQMLEHLGLLFEASNPTKAGMRVHMLTGTVNRMWLDLTGQMIGADEGKNNTDTESKSKTKTKSKDNSQIPDKLLFRPEDILKMVGQKIQVVKIRERNTGSKLETTQIRLDEVEHLLDVQEKKNSKINLENDRLKRLLKTK